MSATLRGLGRFLGHKKNLQNRDWLKYRRQMPENRDVPPPSVIRVRRKNWLPEEAPQPGETIIVRDNGRKILHRENEKMIEEEWLNDETSSKLLTDLRAYVGGDKHDLEIGRNLIDRLFDEHPQLSRGVIYANGMKVAVKNRVDLRE